MDTPPDCVCFNLRKAARAVSRIYDEALAEVGLRNTPFTLLYILHDRGPLAVTDVAELAGMERTTLTRNLRPLELDRLITSEPGEDRRVRVLSLTVRGRKTVKSALPAWRKAQSQALAHLGDARGERLLRDLRHAAALGQ